MFKIGIIGKHTNVVDAVWRKLGRRSSTAQWALLGKYGAKAAGEISLGDLRGAS